MSLEPIIKVEKLNVVYLMGKSNQVNALNDINLEIYPGEFVIFFGPSGCGKSTLLYAISGLERQIHGDIFIENKNLAKFNTEELDLYRREKVGMIFQAYYLINSLTILDNVVLPQLSMDSTIEQRLKKANDLLDYFGVKLQAKKYPNELSGGQQQRAAICRSLINNPDVIMADEPTGNLDSKSVQDVMSVLADLNDKQKKTIIMVTHSPALLEYAHRVFYIKDGHITDVKEQRKLGEKLPERALADAADAAGGGAAGAKKVELVAKTFTDLTKEDALKNSLLLGYKAKEIVAESIAGMTVEELESLERKVERIILGKVKGKEELVKFLDKGTSLVDIDLNKRSAAKLATRIEETAEEIREMMKLDKRLKQGMVPDENEEVKQVRQYLFDLFDIELNKPVALERVNIALGDRLVGRIDRRALFRKLDLPLAEGGAGLDKRNSRRIARHMDILMKGKM